VPSKGFCFGDSDVGLLAATLQAKLSQQKTKALQPKALVLINLAIDLCAPEKGKYVLVAR